MGQAGLREAERLKIPVPASEQGIPSACRCLLFQGSPSSLTVTDLPWTWCMPPGVLAHSAAAQGRGCLPAPPPQPSTGFWWGLSSTGSLRELQRAQTQAN